MTSRDDGFGFTSKPSASSEPKSRMTPAFVIKVAAILVLVVALAAVLLHREGVLGLSGTRAYKVPSASMEPTIPEGDTIKVKDLDGSADVKQGWIVIANAPKSDPAMSANANLTIVKRVIAVPGQTVSGTSGQVLVDGVALNEPYTKGVSTINDSFAPVTLKSGEYWLMGDYRDNSADSRVWGPIQRASIIGHVTSY